jgi:hypothetical protein
LAGSVDDELGYENDDPADHTGDVECEQPPAMSFGILDGVWKKVANQTEDHYDEYPGGD